MSGKQFRGLGRYHQNEKGEPQRGFAYAGHTDTALAAGIGAYNSENLDVLSATYQLGGWDTEKDGTRYGVKAEAAALSYANTPLDEIGALVGLDSPEQQEFLENLWEWKAYGPQAKSEFSAGLGGFDASAGVDWLGVESKLGGSEDEYLWGTELTLGGSAAATPGASFGLHWADEDQDDCRELGFTLGGDFAAGIGLGADVRITTEAFGHAYDALFGSEESTQEAPTLNPPSSHQEPGLPDLPESSPESIIPAYALAGLGQTF